MFGMLSRLDRMVIRETLRSVGYTLAVVLVLAVFGAALRPLGRGDFDSAGDMAEFLFLVAQKNNLVPLSNFQIFSSQKISLAMP